MKTVFKSLVIGLMACSIAFTPALLSLAEAGGIHYEGYSGYKSNSVWGNTDEQARGLMFNFSFGGPKDYKQDSPWQDIYKNNLTQKEKRAAFVLGAVGIFVVIMLMTDEDDECIPYPTLNYTQELYQNGQNYCEPIGPSDRRLKEDVIQIGETQHGLPLYSFRYLGKDRRHIGVMAQDVLKMYPEAVLVGKNGYYMVDYGKLGLAHLLLL